MADFGNYKSSYIILKHDSDTSSSLAPFGAIFTMKGDTTYYSTTSGTSVDFGNLGNNTIYYEIFPNNCSIYDVEQDLVNSNAYAYKSGFTLPRESTFELYAHRSSLALQTISPKLYIDNDTHNLVENEMGVGILVMGGTESGDAYHFSTIYPSVTNVGSYYVPNGYITYSKGQYFNSFFYVNNDSINLLGDGVTDFRYSIINSNKSIIYSYNTVENNSPYSGVSNAKSVLVKSEETYTFGENSILKVTPLYKYTYKYSGVSDNCQFKLTISYKSTYDATTKSNTANISQDGNVREILAYFDKGDTINIVAEPINSTSTSQIEKYALTAYNNSGTQVSTSGNKSLSEKATLSLTADKMLNLVLSTETKAPVESAGVTFDNTKNNAKITTYYIFNNSGTTQSKNVEPNSLERVSFEEGFGSSFNVTNSVSQDENYKASYIKFNGVKYNLPSGNLTLKGTNTVVTYLDIVDEKEYKKISVTQEGFSCAYDFKYVLSTSAYNWSFIKTAYSSSCMQFNGNNVIIDGKNFVDGGFNMIYNKYGKDEKFPTYVDIYYSLYDVDSNYYIDSDSTYQRVYLGESSNKTIQMGNKFAYNSTLEIKKKIVLNSNDTYLWKGTYYATDVNDSKIAGTTGNFVLKPNSGSVEVDFTNKIPKSISEYYVKLDNLYIEKDGEYLKCKYKLGATSVPRTYRSAYTTYQLTNKFPKSVFGIITYYLDDISTPTKTTAPQISYICEGVSDTLQFKTDDSTYTNMFIKIIPNIFGDSTYAYYKWYINGISTPFITSLFDKPSQTFIPTSSLTPSMEIIGSN